MSKRTKSPDWNVLHREAAVAILENPDEYPIPEVEWARRLLEGWDERHPFELVADGGL